ncbi:MAG: hypothetical protein DRN15_00820 [Thermoprotei archaeon]|nr:MAG: hypothetical protein DRM97_04370 [Thermoprotei archaeon]RLF25228.1 MAG: hypothetical protein DRN15_00820 [Thermoprotei archaeon]
MSKMSRRTFLKLIAGSIAALSAVIIGEELYRMLQGKKEKPLPPRKYKSNPYVEEGKVLVSIAKEKDVKACLRKAIDAIGGIERIVDPGDVVVIKPNAGFSSPSADTDPRVIDALIEVLKEVRPSKIIIAESAVRGFDTSFNFAQSGISDVAQKRGVELIDLKRKGTSIRVATPRRMKLESVLVYKEVYDADVIISVPKLKRHVEAVVTISLKNMMGAIPDSEKGLFHAMGLSKCIADLNSCIRPDLVVIDAIEIMTRRGPQGGEMVRTDTIMVSGDPVAADLLAAKMLFEVEGLDEPLQRAMKVDHIMLSAEAGVGVADPERIKVIGENI